MPPDADAPAGTGPIEEGWVDGARGYDGRPGGRVGVARGRDASYDRHGNAGRISRGGNDPIGARDPGNSLSGRGIFDILGTGFPSGYHCGWSYE
jgi:hypothetical protein